MARSFFSIAMQAARAAERARRAEEREALRHAKDAARLQRLSYVEARIDEVEELNRALAEDIGALESLLADALSRPAGVNWAAMRRQLSKEDSRSFSGLKKPGPLTRLLPSLRRKHERRVSEAQTAFELQEAKRVAAIKSSNAEIEQHNNSIGALQEAYRASTPEGVAAYYELAFSQSEYPESFPDQIDVAFQSASRQLVVNFDLPSIDDTVPMIERYRYTKSSDTISETPKSAKSRHALYSSIVAQVALRKLHEIFKADRERAVDVAAVNGFVDTIDRGTGRPIRPCIISVRCSREAFEELDLRHVEPIACLKRLNALVSRSPAELSPVRPIVEFNMSDPRFIQEADVISSLDTRPNLMELTPGEFENLITNLFQRMGLETKLTQASRDGGVDCVAFDQRPVLGGKVVVQAKRYKGTVGVSAVRDLYGTMMNEGASKGILVTTSGYGSAAFDFARGKPIELFQGSELLYLLKEHAGVDAKIVMPDLWSDPVLFEEIPGA